LFRSGYSDGKVAGTVSLYRQLGTNPSGHVHPLAVQTMVELGMDLSAHRSKSTDEFRDAADDCGAADDRGAAFDRVITVCDHAARNYPAWLGTGVVKHMGFPDPAATEGSEEERLAVSRRVRDGLREQVLAYLESDEPAAIAFHLDVGEER
jgi:arsenate reductase